MPNNESNEVKLWVRI